ncbi:signal peptide peptidase SppA [Sphingomonas ginkgonis]|uniref:Signal peptide peptidase SppA n=1 Tax=Sphingomonas ginkgonis TaxID=2315330 RepID=A0A3R9YNG5_9SPHN|nr:signal peptide peptidase SppA [Sphingomonas ginkgonis]RST31782.1 signal peptide peptidase SppA [Sphingomonas ginkgonis]
MGFVRGLWKLLVGIKDGLVLLFMLLFFGLLYVALTLHPTPKVGDGVLLLALNGPIVEQPSATDPIALASGSADPRREYRLRDVRAALLAAARDDRVKAVALDLDRFGGGGQAALGEVGSALDTIRRAGKPVLAYATSYDDDGYQLAAHASEVWMNPLGQVLIPGPGGSQLYYKGLLDKLGVTANVYRVGTYKAAVEPYIRSDASPEAKQNSQALGDSLLESWRDEVRRVRPAAQVVQYQSQLPQLVAGSGGDFGRAALGLKLVDKLGERSGFEARLAQLGGEDLKQPGGYKRVRLDSYVADKVKDDGKAPIGVVTVAGTIVDGRAPLGTAGGESIAGAIERGLRKGGLKALVVRVDSPGGSVTGSERIREALFEARARRIPVVVSMGNVAASGGYWVSTAGNYVFAEPSTITGSIGVFGILPSFQGSLQKLGLGADGIKTTPLSGEPNLLTGPSPEAGQLVQAGVNNIYAHFLRIVADARRKSPQQVNAIAQGRVWPGGAARQLGLIDQFGGMDAAIAKAGDLAGLAADDRDVTYLERPATFRERISQLFRGEGDDDGGSSTDAFAVLRADPQRIMVQALADTHAILTGPTVQVRCLDCGPMSVAPAPGGTPKGMAEMLLAWLLR